MLTSENGILNNGDTAKENTEISEEKNILKASAVSALGANSAEGIIKEDLEYYLDQNIGDEDYILEEQDGQFLVTFIGRNRKTVERGRVFKLEHTLDGIEEPVELNCKHAIPVLLIITPTTIDRNHFSDLDSLGREAFEFSVKETWAKVSVDTSENVAAPAVQSPAGVTQDLENLESACPY